MLDFVIYIILFVFVAANVIVSYIIGDPEKFDRNRSIKYLLSVNLIIAFIIALLNFTISTRGQILQNKIADTVDATVKLSREIEILQGVNNNIVSDVEKLTIKSNSIVTRIDSTTTEESQENALSGQLDIGYSKLFSDTSNFFITFGEYTLTNTLYQIKNWKPHFISIMDPSDNGILPTKPVFDPIIFSVVNNKLVVSLTAFDVEGHWIVQIENNNWHRNPNYTGKFNYNSRGFEIVDNKNNIAINLDLQANNRIIMQGYIVARDQNKVLVAGSKYSTSLALSEGENAVNKEIKNVQITQLFDYTGKGWLGRRKTNN